MLWIPITITEPILVSQTSQMLYTPRRVRIRVCARLSACMSVWGGGCGVFGGGGGLLELSKTMHFVRNN